MNDSLGDRIKKYEDAYRIHLPPRIPTIIRVDGRAFHTLTRKARKPFDSRIMSAMYCAASDLMEDIQGAVLGYCQSDEISILLLDDINEQSQPWFGKNLQKITSVSAAMATNAFNRTINNMNSMEETAIRSGMSIEKASFLGYGEFDARAFVIPAGDVPNYFVWRFKDWKRNSVNMIAQQHYSHKELQNKDVTEVTKMLYDKGIRFDYYTRQERYGSWFGIDNSEVKEYLQILGGGGVDYRIISEYLEKVRGIYSAK